MQFRIGTFEKPGRSFVGLVIGSAVVDLKQVAERTAVNVPDYNTVADLLSDWDRTVEVLASIAAKSADFLEELGAPLAELRPLPPLGRAGKQLYAAANYSDHVEGMRKTFTPAFVQPEKQVPLRPYMFAKVCEQSGANDDIVLPADIERTDWEAELMVVIGRGGRNIPADRAHEHIAGYMATNDVSCRDLTWRDDRPAIRSDWLAGKSFDSFAPTGPFLTPRAFVPDHSNLAVRLWVNGEIKQDGNTGKMTFGIEDQIAYASRLMTLRPGDVIATGTPAGTGQERLEFLKPDDVVETEVELCGRQRNRVVQGSGDYLSY
jgi:2,4-didehydro-3-deoxy-L-rhamnonate hydrolase